MLLNNPHRSLPSFPTRRSSDLHANAEYTCADDNEKVRATAQATRERQIPAGNLAFPGRLGRRDRKSTRLNSSHVRISYAVFRYKKKKLWPLLSSFRLLPFSI